MVKQVITSHHQPYTEETPNELRLCLSVSAPTLLPRSQRDSEQANDVSVMLAFIYSGDLLSKGASCCLVEDRFYPVLARSHTTRHYENSSIRIDFAMFDSVAPSTSSGKNEGIQGLARAIAILQQ